MPLTSIHLLAVSNDESLTVPSFTSSRKKLTREGSVSWGPSGTKSPYVAAITRYDASLISKVVDGATSLVVQEPDASISAEEIVPVEA